MKTIIKKIAAIISAAAILTTCLGGCKKDSVQLDPKNPITITVWHYYNGLLKNAFDSMINEFNETVGAQKGIIVEGFSHGDVSQLETAVMSAVNMEVGSDETPNIFASYADTAFVVEQMGMLADLDSYFTADEQKEYIASYIEEGRIGSNNELKIFPIAKSTEIFMLNQTDWEPFAAETGVTYNDLKTKEGLALVAEKYYNWTDAKTPDILEDGKAFYGRDAMANLFIIASKQFGIDLFEVSNQKVTVNVDNNVMRKIWDTYYVPYINGYFSSYGRFRADDVKVGNIISLTGSTSSASYFPAEVTLDGDVYPISGSIFAEPVFDGGERVAVQQGAGMVVTKSSKEAEYASVLFLKWFTDVETNIEFSTVSGYLPVKEDANDMGKYNSVTNSKEITMNQITLDTISVAFDTLHNSTFYTNKAFNGGTAARKVLEYNLSDKASADREAVIALIEGGMSRQDAVAQFDTEQNFNEWVTAFENALNNAVIGDSINP